MTDVRWADVASGMSSPLSDRRRALLSALPEAFLLEDVRAAAPAAGLVPRSAESAVRILTGRGVLTRVGRGRYVQARRPPEALPRSVVPQTVSAAVDAASPLLLLNRELSWIDFNWRVLAQAFDASTPIAERVRFVAIAARNLDEFVRTRVGGLRQQVAAGVTRLSPDGRTPAEQDRLVRDALAIFWTALHGTWSETLRPLLSAAGMRVVPVDHLEPDERAAADAHFDAALFPLLTPLAVDKGHRFPFISNESLSLAIVLKRAGRKKRHFARLKVPLERGRFVQVEGRLGAVVAIEDLIQANLGRLFPGMKVEGAWAFRVTRSAAVEHTGGETDDLVAMIAEEVRERQFADVLRLEAEASMPEQVYALLMRELELDPADVWPVDGLLDLSGLFELASVAASTIGDASFEPWAAPPPPALAGASSVFEALRTGDVLVHHPYESFAASVERFIASAADDPAVRSIEMTLYRTSDDSPIIDALVRAAAVGVRVAVMVEVQARFDEANNIAWAGVLEHAGVTVAFGVPGLKTHTKTCLVVREEAGALVPYAHVGTGNYNPSTARLYTDLGLLTADPMIGQDVARLFVHISGPSERMTYDRLLIAPEALRGAFLTRIAREAQIEADNGEGRIVAKMNALEDPTIIAALYDASRAGVQTDLVVRGHCRLRPGLPGVSERIRVRSIVGRFLEHDRIFWFGNGGDPEAFIGSADWQRRNLDDRVEAVVPVSDPSLRDRLRAILWSCLRDDVRAWALGPDGRYVRATPGRSPHDHQAAMMEWATRGGPPAVALRARL